MACTKTTIHEKLQAEFDWPAGQATEVLEELLEVIKSTLESGENVMISGFGKFQINDKKPRKGRNPSTGEDMILPGRRTLTFKRSGKLRDLL